MAYKSLKKIITAENEKLSNKEIDSNEYSLWKEATVRKMDVFLSCDRITNEQYTELTNLFAE